MEAAEILKMTTSLLSNNKRGPHQRTTENEGANVKIQKYVSLFINVYWKRNIRIVNSQQALLDIN